MHDTTRPCRATASLTTALSDTARLESESTPNVAELLGGTMPFVTQHCQQWPWREGPVPEELPLTQSWGWMFAPDGRCVVLLDTADWLPLLPGGTIEQAADGGDPLAALEREAIEEAQAAFADPHFLGYVYDAEGVVHGGTGPCARARIAARVTQVGAAAPDPASGQMLLRLLAPAHRAVDLFGWGEQAHLQAEAAERLAAKQWGLRPASHATVSEIPAAGATW